MRATLQIVRVDDQQSKDLEQTAAGLALEYCHECGFKPLPWMAKEFRGYLEKGVEPEMLGEIIYRTARAPRPSWAYLSAIVRRSMQRGLYTCADFCIAPREKPEDLELPY